MKNHLVKAQRIISFLEANIPSERKMLFPPHCVSLLEVFCCSVCLYFYSTPVLGFPYEMWLHSLPKMLRCTEKLHLHHAELTDIKLSSGV